MPDAQHRGAYLLDRLGSPMDPCVIDLEEGQLADCSRRDCPGPGQPLPGRLNDSSEAGTEVDAAIEMVRDTDELRLEARALNVAKASKDTGQPHDVGDEGVRRCIDGRSTSVVDELPDVRGHPPIYPFRGKYYSEIRSKTLKVGGEETLVSEIFESESSGYLIPVIQYKNTKLQDIHRVFSLYNKQGKKLNAEELRNAAYHHLDLTRLLLVMSGDRSDPQAIQDLAPYIPPELAGRFSELEGILADYGFGTARFKRTKVLSWATALMLHKPNEQGDKISTPSTARQIDDLLDDIEEREGAHPLHKQQNLIALAHTWIEALNAHADATSAWSTKFRRRKGGTKWEELPLVASLIATWLLVTAGQAERLDTDVEIVRKVCEDTPPPTKTQNKTQWEFIARFVTKLLDALSVDSTALGQALEQRYEYSCVSTFRRLAL